MFWKKGKARKGSREPRTGRRSLGGITRPSSHKEKGVIQVTVLEAQSPGQSFCEPMMMAGHVHHSQPSHTKPGSRRKRQIRREYTPVTERHPPKFTSHSTTSMVDFGEHVFSTGSLWGSDHNQYTLLSTSSCPFLCSQAARIVSKVVLPSKYL